MGVNPFGIGDFKEKERVVAVVRHHWFVFLRDILGIVILFLIPFFIIPLFWTFASAAGGVPTIPGGVVLFFGALWSLLMWNLLFSRWTDSYFDIWIVTNNRIVDIDQKGLFNRSVATMLNLNHIQDVESSMSGVLGNVLSFGNVVVQTAAAKREFIVDDVANPTKVAQIIREAQAERERVFGAEDH